MSSHQTVNRNPLTVTRFPSTVSRAKYLQPS
jgi:hypothetical protein